MLLLGGNIGDVEARIDRAVELIGERVGEVICRSSMVVSEAWGFNSATAKFTNQAVEIEVDADCMPPERLLDTTQGIERELGRDREAEAREKEQRGERYCSRGIDIDIILYGDMIYESERLRVPHPLMQEREFVLRPIVEIAPEWCNARYGVSCRELLERLEGNN